MFRKQQRQNYDNNEAIDQQKNKTLSPSTGAVPKRPRN